MGKNLNHTLTVLWIRFILNKDPDRWVCLRNNGSESVQKHFFNKKKNQYFSLKNNFCFVFIYELIIIYASKTKKVISQKNKQIRFLRKFPMNLHDFLLPGSVSLNGSGSG